MRQFSIEIQSALYSPNCGDAVRIVPVIPDLCRAGFRIEVYRRSRKMRVIFSLLGLFQDDLQAAFVSLEINGFERVTVAQEEPPQILYRRGNDDLPELYAVLERVISARAIHSDKTRNFRSTSARPAGQFLSQPYC